MLVIQSAICMLHTSLNIHTQKVQLQSEAPIVTIINSIAIIISKLKSS